MKSRWLPLSVAFAAFLPAGATADKVHREQVLETVGFTVRIGIQCQEGEVTCDKVTYQGQSKRTNKSVSLTGKTMHTVCADKVTPCRFLGYIFKTGEYTYFVTEAGELLVRRGEKVIVQQAGQWQ